MKTRNIIVALTVTAALVPVAATAGVARGDYPSSSVEKTIPLDGFRDFVIDWERGQAVIIDSANKNLLVITLRGEVIDRIPGTKGAVDIAMGEDGDSVWIVDDVNDRAVRASLDTLGVLEEVLFDAATCPRSVAETTGKLIVGDHCNNNEEELIVYDLATETATHVPIIMRDPRVNASPARPGIVAVAA